ETGHSSSFFDAPSVILATFARAGLEIDFLALALAHVCYVKIAGLAVKTISPRVAQSDRPDFGLGRGAIYKWVHGRNGVVSIRVRRKIIVIDIDAQNLSQEHTQVLRVSIRIIAGQRPTITGSDVQKPVFRPERNPATFVVPELFGWGGLIYF